MATCASWREARIGFLAAVALLGTLHSVRADDPAKGMVIVYNVEDPDSRPLADYYALKRGVPTSRICEIDVRASETITRAEYNQKIRDPISQFLVRKELIHQEPKTIFDSILGKIPGLETISAKVSCIVLMYGVPLRIDSDPNLAERVPETTKKEFRRNEASVESELATLPTPGAPITGFLRNPFFESASVHFGPPLNNAMLLVGRLDGPDPATVRRMIDDALTAERYGVHGRAYFDWRDTQDRGYVEGDDWIRGAYHACRDAGYECDYDDRPETFRSGLSHDRRRDLRGLVRAQRVRAVCPPGFSFPHRGARVPHPLVERRQRADTDGILGGAIAGQGCGGDHGQRL